MYKKGFESKWQPVEFRNTETNSKHFTFRPWQEEAFKKLHDQHRRIVNAPTGSGKTFAICGLIMNDLVNNHGMKAIVAVPQKIIAKGFESEHIEFPDGTRHSFLPAYNLLDGANIDTCRNTFHNFLDSDPHDDLYDERILICSHATLARAFECGELAANSLKNISLCIDEAHHVRMDDDQSLVDESNKIGKLVEITIGNSSNIVTLTTATFFRGDKGSIVPPSYENDFTRYNLPYDRYLPMMKHLKSFSYDFLIYPKSPIETLSNLYKEDMANGKFKKGIIYLPSVNSSDSWGGKEEEVDSIKAIFGDDWSMDKNGVETTECMGRKISLINLVDDGPLREKRVKTIPSGKKDGEKGPDLIIALGMFKEGANYEALNHQCIIGIRKSLTEIIQIIGRLLRDCEGKEHVSIYHCIPFCIDNDGDDAVLKDSLNNYMKAIYASLILETVMSPKIAKKKGEKEDGDVLASPSGGSCEEEVERASIPIDVIDDIVKEIVEIQNFNDDGKINYDDDYVPIVTDILKENGIPVTDVNVAYVWKALVKRTASIQKIGIDLDDIDFEAIKEMDPLGWMEGYISGLVGGDVLKRFREIMNSTKVEAEARLIELLDWIEEHGRLPRANPESEEVEEV